MSTHEDSYVSGKALGVQNPYAQPLPPHQAPSWVVEGVNKGLADAQSQSNQKKGGNNG